MRFPIRTSRHIAFETSSAVILLLLSAIVWAQDVRVPSPPRITPGPSPRTEVFPNLQVVLTPRVPHSPRLAQFPPRNGYFSDHQITVKFREGSTVRLRKGRLTLPSAAVLDNSGKTADNRAQLESDLSRINNLLEDSELRIVRGFAGVPEAKLDAMKSSAEARSRRQLADLNLYYDIRLERRDPDRVQQIVELLSRLDSVEVAYAAPIPANADIPPTTTIDLRGSQGYRSPAPGGIDVAFARLLPGGGGENVKIADVEFAWQLDHEDLPQSHFLQAGVGATPVGEWNDHGTAVLGELVAVASNNYGVSGIAPAARIGTSSVTGLDAFGIRGLTFYDVGNAVLVAAAAMDPGDVMLIEQHFKGPGSGSTCDTSCGCGEFEYVAMEYFPKEYDAISFATALGIVVVEAAGNGAMNLDAAQYDHLFDRNFRDSQAILVGAGKPASHAPECFSNFGSRLDVQGWGDSVATLGYGDNATLRANGGDSRQWYTRTFSGTSSATPIVAGAAALIQSIRKARGLPPLESAVMRDLLARTGTPQGAGSQIGPLPNLQAALKDTLPDDAEMAGITFDSPLIAGTTVGASVRWRNSGSFPWTPGNYRFTIPLNFDLVSGGNLSATVPPGEVATMPVQIRLPAEPQQYEVTFNFVRSDGSLNLIVGSSEGLFRVRLAGNSTQDAATLSGLDLSSHIIYHIDDDYHAATVSALNSGSRDWAANAGFHLRVLGPSSPGGQPQNPITSTVSRNHTAQLTAHFSCGGAGNRTVRLQMENPEGQPFGNIVSKTITCQHVASGHHPND